ncbi:MAG: hypothetical protein ACRD0K_16680 [Egibacteraceae bacterium]
MGRPARGHQMFTEMRARREVLGWARQALAGRVDALLPVTHGLTYEAIEEWELRERVPSGRYAHALCTLLGTGHIAELGLGHSREAAAHWCWATQPQRRADVVRRTTIDGSALLPVPQLVQEAQLFGRRPHVCGSILGEAHAVATRLASTFIAEPAHPDIDRAARAHARTLSDLLRWACMPPVVRTGLRAIAADASALVGFVALDAGRLPEAELWFGRGLSLARQAGDARLESAMLMALAWLDAPTALREGRPKAGEIPAAMRAWAHAYLSRDLAGVGNAAGSARALHQA